MKWQVILKAAAQKELESLSNRLMQRIYNQLVKLEENPLPRQSKKLQGGAGYRLRVGDYRVLYDLDKQENIVNVFAIRHRREAYR